MMVAMMMWEVRMFWLRNALDGENDFSVRENVLVGNVLVEKRSRR